MLLLLIPFLPSDLQAKLENPAKADVCVFKATDDRARGLDCLKVFQAKDGKIWGLYHTLQDGRFDLQLAETADLKKWRYRTTLDPHAHQGSAFVNPDGSILVAFEKDGPNGNWTRVRWYRDPGDLVKAKPSAEVDLTRHLSRHAEGTPSFESVDWHGNPETSTIKLRFHFYREGIVDRAAEGTLAGFKEFTSKPIDALNTQAENLGIGGNFGDRDSFAWDGKPYHLYEGQLKHSDWSSWRIFALGPDQKLEKLSIRTPKASTSFANPATSWITLGGKKMLVVTLFLPSQGNAPEEAGELVFAGKG